MDQQEREKTKFWLLVVAFIVLPFLTYVYITPRPKCLQTETTTSIETYYDFSESGMGVWQAPATKTICIKWETLK